MNHFVNLSLLFFFTTLVASGLFRYLKPFDLVTTRVHIVFGLGVLLLVGLHLFGRGKYFLGLLRDRNQSKNGLKHPVVLLVSVIGVWVCLLGATLNNYWPANAIISASYEARHAQEIFRSNSRTAYEPLDLGMQVKRVTGHDAGIRLEFEWGPAFQPKQQSGQPLGNRHPQIAIWAEAEDGTVLETLFLSQACAGANEFNWDGHQQSRKDILPIWYERYKKKFGEKPLPDDIDAVSSATPVNDFSMETYLKFQGQPFSVYVEVNAPNDPNNFFHHDQDETSEGYTRQGIGQPSIIYEAYVFPEDERRYALMELRGHSGSTSKPANEVDFEMGDLTSAKKLVEKILLQIELPEVAKAVEENQD